MSEYSAENDALTCVDCGVKTDRWVQGWDGKYRCTKHAPNGRFGHLESEYLLEADEGHLEVTHEPCGERLLLTLRVHLDTLARIAREHECLIPPASTPGGAA